MITKTITVEKNFRTSNHDPYAREKMSQIVDLYENDDFDSAMDRGRKQLEDNFRKRYHYVDESINFEVVVQVKYTPNIEHKNITNWEFTETKIPIQPEKINKGSIEEQIQACKTKDELQSFEMLASMNNKLKKLWQLKAEQINL